MELEGVTTAERSVPRSLANSQNGDAFSLFEAIDNNNFQRFRVLLNISGEANILENFHNGNYTLLQYTCVLEDRSDFAEELLKRKLSPNSMGPKVLSTPLLLAAEYGHHIILKMLLDDERTEFGVRDLRNCKMGVLHKVVMAEHSVASGRDYMKCIDLLLGFIKEFGNTGRKGLNLNAVDDRGNTPLHYASRRLQQSGEMGELVIIKLLHAGADIGIRNITGEAAFMRMPADLLESFLDECITTNGKPRSDKDFKVTFRYQFLIPSNASPNCLTGFNRHIGQPLLLISSSEEHRRLLKHPVLASCIYLMWFRIRWMFYLDIVIYLLFVLAMTMYIMVLIESGIIVRSVLKITSPVFTLFYIIVIKELVHVVMSKGKYLKYYPRLLKIPLFILTALLLLSDLTENEITGIGACTVLLMGSKFAIMIGQHPRIMTYMHMYRTVFRNYFAFFFSYFAFIVAFAFSFHILFRNKEPMESSTKDLWFQNFNNPWTSIIKTVLLMLGEYDVSSIPFGAYPELSYLLFTLFLTFIALVLTNLLNGMAVSDTQGIVESAEIVGYVSQIEFFSQIELMITDVIRLLTLIVCCTGDERQTCKFKFSDRIEKITGLDFCCWTTPFWKLKAVEVMVSKRELIQHCICSKCMPRCLKRTMDKKIVEKAISIISRKKKTRTLDDIWRRLDDIENLIRSISVSVVGNGTNPTN